MAKKLVVVLGMHRSGTSAITRGLQALGVDLGQSFIPNYDDNIKGFWEDADFQAINVEMLHALGQDWHTLSVFTDDDLPKRLSAFRLRALALLKQKLSSSSIVGVKDPRFSRLLPFWKELFISESIDVCYVVALRNPISVALSLQKRNGFKFEKSFYLWQQHMLLSLLSIDSEPSVIVDFDLMLVEPEVQLSRISSDLGLSRPSKESLQEYSERYLDQSLRHAKYTLTDLRSESSVPAGVLELFGVLSLLAEDKKAIKDNDVHELLIRQLQDFKQLSPLLQLIDHSERSVNLKNKKNEELETKLGQRIADIQQQTRALSQLRGTIEQQKSAIEAHKAQLTEQTSNHQRIISEHRQVIEDHKKRLVEQREQHQRALNECNSQLSGRLNECKERLSQQLEVHAQYKTQKEEERSDQQRLLVLRHQEIDRLRAETEQKNTKLNGTEKQLAVVSGQLTALESRYNKFVATPEWKVGSQLRLLARTGSKFFVPLKLIKGDKSSTVFSGVSTLVEHSGVFDEEWYKKGFPFEQQPDDPLRHYLSIGWKEGRTPSLLFDGNWYLEYYPDVKAAGVCPLRHYLELGWKENRRPHPAFDGEWYLCFYDDIRSAGISPLQHYVRFGAKEGRKPNRVFDVEWFSKKYAEKITSLASDGALVSYLLASQKEGGVYEHHPLFRSVDYAAKNPEFEPGKGGALSHLLPRVQAYIQETALQSVFNEGILKSFDQKLADAFCLRVRRAEFTGNNEVNDPLVSIVMPTHNRSNKICSAIDSVLEQSYGNWELLIVDDGSEDNTYQLVQDTYSDPRISIQRTGTEARGVCHARNLALTVAKGELIAYLDSDNAWVKEFLEVMVAYLQQENANFAYSAIRMHNEGGTSYRYREFDYADLLIKNFIDLNAILHKRELYDQLGGFDESLSRMVDWDLVIRYTASAKIESAPFIGVDYDNHKQPDRITVKEPKSWRYAIMNKHLIDWGNLAKEAHLRDKNLVSVIIPIYGQLDLTRKCVESLLYIPAGRSFEIILVDNGSDYQVLEELFMWSEGLSEVTLVRNLENLNFALGCNLGFVHSRGAQVVFLNNDTEVTAGWLDALLTPLKGEIGAVQPKLLYPDGRIQCAGIAFSEHSAIGFPIYADFPANLPAVNKSRQYQAITAACMAVGSGDFAQLQGFDPLYVNGQEDVDFCLRLAELGKVCWYESTSVVVHHESRTPGRGQFIAQNRILFDQRWSDKIIPDAEKYFHADGYRVRGWRTDGHKIKGFQPVLSKKMMSDTSSSNNLTIAIKVPCPHAGVKNEWGDYHFARSLGGALRRAGYSFRIDFLDEWGNGEGVANEVNLVLRGLSAFEPRAGQINVMWMISHPDKVGISELKQFDHIFVASSAYTNSLKQQGLAERVSCLLQCTDPAIFSPDERKPEFKSDVLFVGNSRNQYRDVVKHAIDEGHKLSIYGTRWEQFVSAEYIKGENIPNDQLGNYYRNASVVLNDHWPDMREKGFISNRVFDVLACGRPVISDRVNGFSTDLEDFVTFYDYDEGISVSKAVRCLDEEDLMRTQERFKFALELHCKHSFDARTETILSKLEELLEDKYYCQDAG